MIVLDVYGLAVKLIYKLLNDKTYLLYSACIYNFHISYVSSLVRASYGIILWTELWINDKLFYTNISSQIETHKSSWEFVSY